MSGRKKLVLKITIGIVVLVALLICTLIGVWVKGLPALVSNKKFINYIQNEIEKSLDVSAKIDSPKLKTGFSPDVVFELKGLDLKREDTTLLVIKDFELEISLANILKKRVILKDAEMDYIFADINKILDIPALKENESQTQKATDWVVDVFQSVVEVDKGEILYSPTEGTNIQIFTDGLKIDDELLKKKVSYDVTVDITRGKDKLHITATDDDKVYLINKEKFTLDDVELSVNDRRVKIDGFIDAKSNYDFTLSSKKFSIPYVLDLLDTQIVPNNIGEMLVYFKDIDGNFDFDIRMDNENMGGNIKLNNGSLKLIPMMDLPLTFNQGNVKFDNNRITLKDFHGYYNNKPSNKMNFDGTVDDYFNSVDTNIVGYADITNDFTVNYLAKMANTPITMEGEGDTKLILKSKYNKFDIIWVSWFKQGNGFIFDGSESAMNDAASRVLSVKMGLEDTLLTLKSASYYAVNDKIDKEEARIPILSMNGHFDISTGEPVIQDFGMELPKPMPTGFINMLLKQRLFKNGTITGNMRYINTGKYPVLDGDMKMEKVGIPSQRLFIKEGEFKAENGLMTISSNGRYRGSKYNVSGKIVNELRFPIIVKTADLGVDNIDVERYLRMFNTQAPGTMTEDDRRAAVEHAAEHNISVDADDDVMTFDLANLIIEECILHADKGFYKDINFSDVKANLTLDKNSVLELKSNKFNIAEGTSTADIVCDLRNHLYKIRLALIQVNSDLMATSLLNLPREINGKASGLIELNTDDSLKLNGRIQFRVYEGIIAKIGLVEYLMKVASLFRNPLTMISPTVISDLVSIPEGKFDQIDGDLKLKDNVVMPMMIKSTSDNLSSFIIGTYNLENGDAALRIYTKFSNSKKGVYGFLRNISLNSLANRMPLSSRNDSHYYAAEIEQIPPINAEDKDCQIFLTKVDGDVVNNNFISSLKKIK